MNNFMDINDIDKALKEKDDIRCKNNILKTVKAGSLLIFKSSTPNARVTSIHDAVKTKGDISEARLFAKHDDGHESYHTYRYDGMSHHSEMNDIQEIQN